MRFSREDDDLFVRVDPGEPLVASIRDACRDEQIEAASIVSGVGMLEDATLGFFDIDRDDYDTRDFTGPFDLSVVCGNVTRLEDMTWPHVHAVFNDARFRTLSGHVMEAHARITIEVFLRVVPIELMRRKVAGCPATRILVPGED